MHAGICRAAGRVSKENTGNAVNFICPGLFIE